MSSHGPRNGAGHLDRELTLVPPILDTSRDLLFGLLALQTGLIDQGQLLTAFHTWSQAGDRPLAYILAEQGAISSPCQTLVEGLVIEHLGCHGDDSDRSLAAIGVGRSTRECLARIGDPRADGAARWPFSPGREIAGESSCPRENLRSNL
jgi:hypothetical protein